jgi:hypothetical protein
MKDANGQRIKVGDTVRICGIPDLSGMSPHIRSESMQVFQHLVGKRKRIADVDEAGNAEFMFRLKEQGKTAIHWVRIERHLLKKPQARGCPNKPT